MAGIILISGIWSCSADLDSLPEFMSELEVSGKVYDFDDPAGSGVEDMMIVLSSYEAGDQSFKFPISRDTAYSDASGTFRIRTIAMSEGWMFRLSAKDSRQDRPHGTYSLTSTFDPVLHIEFNRNTFDENTGAYRIEVPVPVTRKFRASLPEMTVSQIFPSVSRQCFGEQPTSLVN